MISCPYNDNQQTTESEDCTVIKKDLFSSTDTDSGIDIHTSKLKISENEEEIAMEENGEIEVESHQQESSGESSHQLLDGSKSDYKSKAEQLENTIIEWVNKEKELLGMKETLTSNDFGNYSILMYETQDAYNHYRDLRMRLEISEQQLRIKTKQCNTLVEQNNHFTKRLYVSEKKSEEREQIVQMKLKKSEKRLIDLYGENEWLQGKYDEIKQLCSKYRKKYANDQTTHVGSVENIHTTTKTRKTSIVSRPGGDINSSEDGKARFRKAQEMFNNSDEDANIGIEKFTNDQLKVRGVVEEVILEETILSSDKDILLSNEQPSTSKDEDEIFDSDDMKQQHHKENEERPRRDTISNSDFISNYVSSDEFNKQLHDIKAIAQRNDNNLHIIVTDCQKVISDNSVTLGKLQSESKEATDRMERWVENYMILKRKTEEGDEINKRELKKSWHTEKEYRAQIKTLCDTINQLASEVSDEKSNLDKYKTSFQSLCVWLQKMEQEIETLQELSNEKASINEGRLSDLTIKFEQLQGNEEKKRRSTASRKLSKTLFNLKRRMSETNESGK